MPTVQKEGIGITPDQYTDGVRDNHSTQLNSKMFICNMQEHTYNHIGSLKPMTGLFDSTYI